MTQHRGNPGMARDSSFSIPPERKCAPDLLQIIKDYPEHSKHRIAGKMHASSAFVNKYLSSLTEGSAF